MALRSLLGLTKSKILDLVSIRKRTARETASIMGIQVNAARKHLESLKGKGLVKEEYTIEGFGRPKKFYLMSGRGRELYQNQSSSMLNLVLRKIIQNNGWKSADRIIKQTAREISSSMCSNSETNKRKKLEQLVTSLDEFGFETELKEDAHSYAIISHNCPLRETAGRNQKLICDGLHSTIIKCALGTESVKLDKCIALDDDFCMHVLHKQI